MILKTKEEDGVIIAEIQIKEANLVLAEQFKKELLDLINMGKNHIVLDFRNVEYVDSSFLGSMVSSLKMAIANKSDMAVIHLNKDIEDLFNLTRLNKVFNIYPNKRMAVMAANKF
jgi:anti-sigma B factor antagonist